MSHKKIIFLIGTIAELIKLAPVLRALQGKNIDYKIITTGQNKIPWSEFPSIKGNHHVIYACTNQGKTSSLVAFVIWSIRCFISLLFGLRSILQNCHKSNTYFVVHGDTVTSLIGAIIATIYRLNLVHIESGPRSYHFLEPFPEEICRFVVSRLSDINFCPNSKYVKNLKHVKGININTGQNTLIESFWYAMKKKSKHELIKRLHTKKIKYYVLVIHRQEHVVFGKQQTKNTLKYIFKNIPNGLQCVFLIHNITLNIVYSLDKDISKKITSSMIRSPRMPYEEFMHLLQGAEFLITDGGSNQQEMFYMGKPCLVVRNYTETIEGLRRNVVLAKNNERIIKHFIDHYNDFKYPPLKVKKLPSDIIVNYLFPETKGT